MRIKHKFLTVNHQINQLNWDTRFYTQNAILKNIDLYKPEILFLGTFNPQLSTNPADFFYGRNYFWTAFKNLFLNGNITLTKERLAFKPYDPTLHEIFQLCIRLKITFTDLIESVFDNTDNNQVVVRANKEYISFNNQEYNPISDGHLQRLNTIDKVNWNTKNIITYLNQNNQLRKIYFTRQDSGCWQTQLNSIRQALPEIEIIPIYTPSAQGGVVHQQTGMYKSGKMIPLLRHWVHNNNGNYGNLNHSNWLTDNGVNIDKF